MQKSNVNYKMSQDEVSVCAGCVVWRVCALQNVLVTIQEVCGLGLMMIVLPTLGDLGCTLRQIRLLACCGHPKAKSPSVEVDVEEEHLWLLPWSSSFPLHADLVSAFQVWDGLAIP